MCILMLVLICAVTFHSYLCTVLSLFLELCSVYSHACVVLCILMLVLICAVTFHSYLCTVLSLFLELCSVYSHVVILDQNH